MYCWCLLSTTNVSTESSGAKLDKLSTKTIFCPYSCLHFRLGYFARSSTTWSRCFCCLSTSKYFFYKSLLVRWQHSPARLSDPQAKIILYRDFLAIFDWYSIVSKDEFRRWSVSILRRLWEGGVYNLKRSRTLSLPTTNKVALKTPMPLRLTTLNHLGGFKCNLCPRKG